jgi:hypothetical protein
MRFKGCAYAARLHLARLRKESGAPEPTADSTDAAFLHASGDVHEEAYLEGKMTDERLVIKIPRIKLGASLRIHRDHEPRLRRMAHRLRRRQDDHRAARPAHPTLRHRRDWQRELALQEPRPAHIDAAPPLRFDRASARFRGLAGLARMFLSARRQRADAGAEDGIALLFPMNDLFEAFVGRLLQRHFGPGRVNLQVRGRHALRGPDGPLFALRPDAVIDTPEGPLIIDTKWKALKPEDAKLGVAQADVYQMLAYAEAWGRDGAHPRVLLLYPHHAALGPEGPLASWSTHGADLPFGIARCDIGRADAASNGDALRCAIMLKSPFIAGSKEPHPSLALQVRSPRQINSFRIAT